ncbi:MAG: hypothetical protein AAGD28_04265 [Bacteroidota bacterium]
MEKIVASNDLLMERITNDMQRLFEEARKEITDFSLAEGETMICSLYEYPAIVGQPYQMVLILDQHNKMRFSSRSWDRTYDLIRWKEGIYNLDRLRILEKDMLLIESQTKKLRTELEKIATKNLPQSLEKEGALVLDGSEWRLHINWNKLELNYEWKASNEGLAIFLPLIESLLSIAKQA